MKIAIVHRYYPMKGGVTLYVDEMRKEFDKRGIDYTIFTRELVKNDKKVISLSNKSTLGFYLKLGKLINRGNFDIIHTHSSPLVFLKHLLKNKIILTIHGFVGVRGFENDFVSSKDKMGPFLQNNVYGPLKVLSYKMSDHLILVGKFMVDELSKKYKIDKKKMSVIYTPIPVDMLRPLPTKRKDKTVKILMHSTQHRKGFDFVVKWVEQLSKEIDNFKIIVAGGDKDKIPKHLENLFEIRSQVPFSEMPQVYNSCDIVILPSLYDPFGTTAAEGMSCGKPAIVSKFVGSGAFIENGVSGFVCDFDDFPKKMALLIKDAKLRKEMGKKAAIVVRKELTPSIISDKFIKLYDKVINEK